MKRHAFLIVAHRYPELLGSLVEQLESDRSTFFIHIDAKSVEMMGHRVVESLAKRSNIHLLLPQRSLFWGGFSQIRVTVDLIESAISTGEYDYFHLLSGQDFLTKSKEEFFAFFDCATTSFLELDESDRGFHERMAYYYLNDLIDLPNASSFVATCVCKWNGLQHRFRRLIRRNPLPFCLYKGASWWSLRAEELNELARFLASNPLYLARFRCTQCADELFVQSVLFNLPDWQGRISPISLRYVDWEPLQPSDRLPHVLTLRQESAIRLSDAFFARKVEPERSKELLFRFGITV